MKAINYSSSICTRTRKSVFSGLCAPGTRVFKRRRWMYVEFEIDAHMGSLAI